MRVDSRGLSIFLLVSVSRSIGARHACMRFLLQCRYRRCIAHAWHIGTKAVLGRDAIDGGRRHCRFQLERPSRRGIPAPPAPPFASPDRAGWIGIGFFRIVVVVASWLPLLLRRVAWVRTHTDLCPSHNSQKKKTSVSLTRSLRDTTQARLVGLPTGYSLLPLAL